MSKSVYVRFRGRNHLAINHLSPLDTTDDGISFYADKETTTVIGKLNYTASQFQFDSLGELTTGAGVTIDSVLLKDGSTILPNDTYYKAKNSAGTPQDILKINGSNALILSSLWNTAATRASLGAAASGANADITSISGSSLTISTTTGDDTESKFNSGGMEVRNTVASGQTAIRAISSDYSSLPSYRSVELHVYNPSHATAPREGWLVFQNCDVRKILWNSSGNLTFSNSGGNVWTIGVDFIPVQTLTSDIGSAAKVVDKGYINTIYCDKVIPASAASYDFTAGSGASNFDLTSDSMSIAQICQSLRAFHRALSAAGITT